MVMMNRSLKLAFLAWVGSLLIVPIVRAQLTDQSQTTPSIPGGVIAKSLEEQVGAGHADDRTFGSAVYLIERDPARAIRRGRQLFQRKFTQAQGDVVTRPDSRDAPHLFGLGLQEMLAQEITADLRAIRDDAVRQATSAAGTNDTSRRCKRSPDLCTGSPATRPLTSKGIAFGWITAYPDGSVDASRVEGVDADLRVRPFFAQGGTISIREFIVGAFKAEMGLEAPDAILCDATDPVAPRRRVSPAGFVFDPEQDRFERPPVCDVSEDGDGDGVRNEVDTAVVDYMEFYLLNYFKPGLGRQTIRTRTGRHLLDRVGCTRCHVEELVIDQDRRVADVQTVHDPVHGIFNRLFATATTQFAVVEDGDRYPRLEPKGEPFVVENIFTDFKRHDLGEAFHEREYDGTLQTEFLTEPLWGVGSTAPYGHDGRSIDLEEVILRHGGEALRSRNAYAALPEADQRLIVEFLESLVLFPPDDTASNLNPGDPDGDPQQPANHGSINLGALFQIPEEGPE
jgi:hypothetical protein